MMSTAKQSLVMYWCKRVIEMPDGSAAGSCCDLVANYGTTSAALVAANTRTAILSFFSLFATHWLVDGRFDGFISLNTTN